MEVIRITYPDHQPLKNNEPMSMAVGYFDGVHIGHQKVINSAIAIAKDRGIKSAVMTFDPHPITVLKQEKLNNFLITSLNEKILMFEQLGVDYVFIVTFNQQLSKLTPSDFVKHFFINLNVKHVVGGFDFSFGHKGAGKIQLMDEYANGQLLSTVVDKVSFEDEKVSSTRIRESIKNGDMTQCKKLLGRPFSLTGQVVKGHQRGREIGFPTANIEHAQEHIVPKVGVYAVTVFYNGKMYNGMANIGFNPTFMDQLVKPVLEVNIFDFNEDIYNKEIIVYFHRYIRDEKKFNSVDELIDQMKDDEIQTKKILTESD
ncbi:bifunctional riboflavin kinase/FAD synthetase [Bacillaceae bacterium W0354]